MNMRLRNFLVAVVCVSMFWACHNGDNVSFPDDTVAVVGKNYLTRSQIRKASPGGLSPADSTDFAHAYIRSWLDAKLISEIAISEIDMTEIDRLTAEYRSELIMANYRRMKALQDVNGIFSQDSLLEYYNTHKSEFVLQSPLVRGIYLKVPEEAPNLKVIRKLFNSDKPQDLDRLEKEANTSAIHYDYFRDKWVDWVQIENRIPENFPEGNVFLARKKPLDLNSGGFVYLLSISDYIPSGYSMPFEAAEQIVRDRLLTRRRRAFDIKLRNELLEKSIASGDVLFPSGNPLQ